MSKRTHKLVLITIFVIVLSAASFVTVGARRNDLSFVENSGLTVVEDRYFTGLPEKTQASVVMERVADTNDVYIKNNKGSVCLDNEVVGTGFNLSVIQFNVTNKTLEAVVIGDITGDGLVRSVDYMRIKKAFDGSFELEGAFLEAADVNRDGKLATVDYMRIKKYMDNQYDLYTDLPEVTPAGASAPTANPYILGNSVEYANQVKNQVDTTYVLEDGRRTSMVIQNATMTLTHGLMGAGEKQIQEFANKDGGVYFTDSFVPYLQEDDKITYLKDGSDTDKTEGTPVIRNGYYYYETHLRHIDFHNYNTMRLDLIYNTLADSLRVNQRLIIDKTSETTKEFKLGNELKLAKSSVKTLELKDANGTYSSINNYDTASVEYVAFDIKDAGVVGLIYATDSLYEDVTVTLENGYYVIRSTMKIPALTEGTVYDVAMQLYNDSTHDFAGIRKASHIERNPVAVTTGNYENLSKIKEAVYDSTTGLYRISAKAGSSWNTEANKYAFIQITANNDNQERPIYLQLNTSSGNLATGVIRNEEGAVVAIPAEVCKNFAGDDPSYEADIAYGDIIYPVYLEENETVTSIPTCLWQNWGEYPLVQLSSIQYYFMYLHMSMNLTETTCLTPSGAGGYGGNIVADFRGVSGIMWTHQPQFNHAGNFYFTNEDNIRWNSEYKGMDILSSGPNYIEADFYYTAESGNYEYTLTHMEFPSDDETRNYYSLEITFLKDTYYNNTKNKFQLLQYYTTMGTYSNIAWRDAEGVVQEGTAKSSTCELDPDGSFFTFYTNSNPETENMAVIVKDYSLVMNGQEVETSLLMRVLNNSSAALVLNEGKMNFRAGDKITVDFVLLPYGDSTQTHYENVLNVYNDVVTKPLTTTVTKGTLIENPFMPKIYAENNTAAFSVSGGANKVAVRIDGFDSDTPILIEEYVDGQWVTYDNSVKGYDGYYIYYNEDNTYGFSFVVDMGTEGSARQFRISQ